MNRRQFEQLDEQLFRAKMLLQFLQKPEVERWRIKNFEIRQAVARVAMGSLAVTFTIYSPTREVGMLIAHWEGCWKQKTHVDPSLLPPGAAERDSPDEGTPDEEGS